MPRQIHLLLIREVHLHDIVNPTLYSVINDSNIVHMTLKIFLNHETSYTSRSILSSLRVADFSRDLLKPLILRKWIEDNSDPYLAILALPTTNSSSDISASEFLIKRKLHTLLPSLNLEKTPK